jgi:4-aminobutyrate aminotransferase-like enzyme
LLHAMGDVHPHALKARLARELSRLTFERWSLDTAAGRNSPTQAAKTLFTNSGFEAVEAALKTALLATGKSGVIAFEAAYHGLGYGALVATHRQHFRGPFQAQLRDFGHFLPFPGPGTEEASRRQMQTLEKGLRTLFRRHKIGAILVEPVQARGGIHVPPPSFLPLLRQVCDEHRALLILDEIYTGFGRTGKWFACEHSRTIPDLICLGKALTGGFPLSACVGDARIMDAAWPASTGEAIHTSTFLGHPVGCAMALAQIGQIEKRRLPERAARLGADLLAQLSLPEFTGLKSKSNVRGTARGLGLMAGLELTQPNGEPATRAALDAVKALLQRGYIFLPEGEHANVISFTPPLTITRAELNRAVLALAAVLKA